MVAGVQPYCFAQAAAATLKLLRSAHSNTLPQKNTMTQTVQGMGRAALRVLVLAESELTVISPSRHIHAPLTATVLLHHAPKGCNGKAASMGRRSTCHPIPIQKVKPLSATKWGRGRGPPRSDGRVR